MKLAINYSPEAADLVRKNKINLDYFKTPPWMWMVEEAQPLRPVRIHFPLRVGDGSITNINIPEIKDYMARTGTHYLNVHFSVKTDDYPNIIPESLSAKDRQTILTQALKDLDFLSRYFSPQSIILENIPWRKGQDNNLRACVEPQLFRGIFEQFEIGFLLDISHAVISAASLGMDYQDYILSLPVDRAREVHSTGILNWDGFLRDHMEIQPRDWQILDWVLDCIHTEIWSQPDMLAFEYGGVGDFFGKYSDSDVIETQIPQLYSLVHKSFDSKIQ